MNELATLTSDTDLSGTNQFIWDARTAYDLGAASYDTWHWQKLWQRLEWPLVESAIRNARERRRILDVGIGTGALTERVLESFDVEFAAGVDISAKMLERCTQRLANRVPLHVAAASAIPFHSQSFDVALMCRVAGHVAHPEIAFREISRVLRIGATFVLTDVHPLHKYRHTRIPSPIGKLAVETYKHPTRDLVSAGAKCQFRLVRCSVISSSKAAALEGVDLPRSVDAHRPNPLARTLVFEKTA
jgi:SAM-dependent methyltransferase